VSNREFEHFLQRKLSRRQFLSYAGVTALSLFGVFRVIAELNSHASGVPIAFEPEGGTLGGGSKAVLNAAASGGKAVQFGALTGLPRPSGVNYQRVEDLYRTGETPANTDVVTIMKRRDASKILTFPLGVFEFADFTYLPAGNTYHYGFDIGIGIVGSGPGNFGMTDGTIFQMKPMTSTRAVEVPPQDLANGGSNLGATNQLYLVHAVPTGGVAPVLAQCRIKGTEQGHPYGGVVLYGTNGATVTDVLITGIPGTYNGPPGETFGFNNAVNQNLTATRLEASGLREPDGHAADNTSVGAAGIGNNSSSNCTYYDAYVHDNWTSTFAFWQCHDMVTYNTRSLRNGSGNSTSRHSGHGINHERCGYITHINPVIDTQHDTTANSGYHFSWNADPGWTTDYKPGYLRIVNPKFNPDNRAPGRMIVWSGTPYDNTQNLYGKSATYAFPNTVSVWATSPDNGVTGTPFTAWYYAAG
jgi:hypothetical protein